jgi:hypothetical protein
MVGTTGDITMRIVIYWIVACLAFLSIPIVTLACNIITPTSLKDIYIDWYDWMKSGKAWGPLDRGRKIN